MEQVEEICEEIVLINNGANVLQGRVKDIKNSYKDNIFNVDFNSEWTLNQHWKWNINLLYSLGKDSNHDNLPLINPLSYRTALTFTQNRFNANLEGVGHATQTQFGSAYGETKTPDFALLNANFGYKFVLPGSLLYTKLGIENLLDAFYTTYADWNKIPRMGRNIFLNLNYSF